MLEFVDEVVPESKPKKGKTAKPKACIDNEGCKPPIGSQGPEAEQSAPDSFVYKKPEPIKIKLKVYTGEMLFDTPSHKKGNNLQFVDAGPDNLYLKDMLHTYENGRIKYLVSKSHVVNLQHIDEIEVTRKS